jgi:phosphate starvation-inducible protein PhoH and related proteins
VKILVPGGTHIADLVGQRDELLRRIEGEFSSDILVRGNEITITGENDDAERAATLFEELLTLVRQGQTLTTDSVDRAVAMVKTPTEEGGLKPSQVMGDTIISTRGRPIRPKTAGQKRYVDAIRENTLTFGIGPAGTGKTYLAVAMAVKALREKEVQRIILTRPAVEAGERLGFLPGDISQKVDPYLRPLYDALYEMLEPGHYGRLSERGTIEIAPLAFARGRTFNDSFIILDEAQNTTPEQMKMFLTRMGMRSRAVVTGDITQIDLPEGQTSGLVVVQDILRDIKGLRFVYLEAVDVVRHRIVQDIVEAYRTFEEKKR